MTKVGLLSDTHAYWDEKYLQYFETCDEIWHAGDIGSLEVAQKLAAFRPFRAVYGNIDGQEIRTLYPQINVSDYNSLINAADDSETKQISRNLESMKSLTDINSKSLAKVGITVDSKSGKLFVDEDTFKKADSTKVDALFKGNGSYAYAVASKASMLEYAAKNEAEKTNTYGANGRYTQAYNSGYNYNMFL